MPNIELLNMDCMEYMKGCEDNAFDLAVVDPPYGINVGVGLGKWLRQRGEPEKLWDSKCPEPKYFKELNRVSKNAVIWGGNYFDLPPSRAFIVWDKGEGFKGRSYAECEFAWVSLDGNAKIYKRDPLAGGDYRKKIHPTQKPVKLYDWILSNYAKPTDRILDTHLGSGSSAIAAHYFGCDFVGMEIDQDYYKAACDRFEKETAQLDLLA